MAHGLNFLEYMVMINICLVNILTCVFPLQQATFSAKFDKISTMLRPIALFKSENTLYFKYYLGKSRLPTVYFSSRQCRYIIV